MTWLLHEHHSVFMHFHSKKKTARHPPEPPQAFLEMSSACPGSTAATISKNSNHSSQLNCFFPSWFPDHSFKQSIYKPFHGLQCSLRLCDFSLPASNHKWWIHISPYVQQRVEGTVVHHDHVLTNRRTWAIPIITNGSLLQHVAFQVWSRVWCSGFPDFLPRSSKVWASTVRPAPSDWIISFNFWFSSSQQKVWQRYTIACKCITH